MAPRPIIDLEAINVRRAEEIMKGIDILKIEIAAPVYGLAQFAPSGEHHASARLSREDAREIRDRLKCGEGVRALARAYGIDPKTIRKVRAGITWKSTGTEPVPPPLHVEGCE